MMVRGYEMGRQFKEMFAMNPVQLFGVAVRTIGLLTTMSASWAIFVGLFLSTEAPLNVTIHLVSGIPAMIIGLWLLRGAKALVAFAYPEDRVPAGPAHIYPLAADKS
jgi:exosortase/archaeosortase